MWVAGLDGCKGGWVGILLEDGRFSEARIFSRAEDALDTWTEPAVLAIDIPIGLPDASTFYRRPADVAAREFLARRGASVFSTPAREVLQALDYREAQSVSRALAGTGISQQSWALRTKIMEVDEVAKRDSRVHEVHPEVSFGAMSDEGPLYRKKSWNGLMERRQLLRSEGIEIPESLGSAGAAASDDVLDAGAAAWSAARILAGQALTLPEVPPVIGGRAVAIYY